jgi:CDP-2,3-bis-(O-geranylgeranyl)-sn-glycerol synthase
LNNILTMPRSVQLAYLMLPAYLANMAPPFTRYWPGWNRPISRKWLGDHKTVVGFGAGLTVAMAATFVQSKLNWHGGLLPYAEWPRLGLAFGVGAMGGDSLKSFVKRLKGIPPGRPWIPMDQLDFVVGSIFMPRLLHLSPRRLLIRPRFSGTARA